jgi:phage-related protein (TIGR01555 family)
MPQPNFSKGVMNEMVREIRSTLDSYAFTGLVSQDLGIGTGDDKLTSFNDFTFKYISPNAARRLYGNGDILQNIVDTPAMDAVREGFELTSDFDEFDASKIMTQRLKELCIDTVQREHLENIALYCRGSMVMPVCKEWLDVPKQNPLSVNLIRRVEAFNVLPEDDFEFMANTIDPFKASYMKPMATFVRGQQVDETRFKWDAYKFFPRENQGVSMIAKVLLACLALRVTNWSLASVMLEIQNKVLQVENLDNYAMQDGGIDLRASQVAKREGVMERIKRWMTSQKMLVIDKNDTYTRQMYAATGTKEATDFFWEFLSAVTGYPQATIKGQAMGTISAADVDSRRYAQKIKTEKQDRHLRPLVMYLINILKYEQHGEFYRKFGSRVSEINFNLKFNNIWKPDELGEAQIKLTNSQRGQIDVQNGVRDADQVREELYPNLEQFDFPTEGETDPPTSDETQKAIIEQQRQIKQA